MQIQERPLVLEENEKEGLVIERIDYTDGIKVYLQGHTVPFKGMPTEGAVQAINVIKKLLRLQPLQAAWIAIEPHILKPEYQQPITREVCKMFPNKMGITIAHVLEYDSAYRFFIQDLLSETTSQKLLNAPYSEVRRLIAINARRCADNPQARKKMRYTGHIFILLLCLPSFRRAIRTCDFSKLQTDADDRYWIEKRLDYKAYA